MPELPEVETVRRQLEPLLAGETVVDAGSHPSEKFTPASEVIGCQFGTIRRRGKYLLIAIDDDRELIAHLGMTGSFGFISPAQREKPEFEVNTNPHLRAWWLLGNGGRVDFVDIRRFGRLRVVPTGDYSTITTLHLAGPEPFDPTFDGDAFWERLQRSKQNIKTQLLSQRPVAGVGNIYADEALWLASVNPKATQISKPKAAELLTAIREVLQQGIKNGGTTLRNYQNVKGDSGSNQLELKAYGRSGLPCLRCKTILQSVVISSRNTVWCPICQTGLTKK